MLSTRLLMESSCSSTMSRNRWPSPAMLPKHQQHCSRTSAFVDRRSRINKGVMPRSTITWVCSVDAMLVSAHAASNCSAGFSRRPKNSASTGTTPLRNTGTTGGSVSLDRSRRICFVPSNCAVGSSLIAASEKIGRWSSATSLGTIVSGAVAPGPLARPPAAASSAAASAAKPPAAAASSARAKLRFFLRLSRRLSLRSLIWFSVRFCRPSAVLSVFLKFLRRKKIAPLVSSGTAPVPSPPEPKPPPPPAAAIVMPGSVPVSPLLSPLFFREEKGARALFACQ
mmetsp:Transcript_85959/g.208247  ORF Transcript_85959/g.208247 Transcript_85959/m.208247 type:complete len:283 (+) Transcript_85959:420-1268(+)